MFSLILFFALEINEELFSKRDKRQIKKKMSLSCHFAVYWTYSLLHQCFMPNRYISLFKMYCEMQFFSKPL